MTALIIITVSVTIASAWMLGYLMGYLRCCNDRTRIDTTTKPD